MSIGQKLENVADLVYEKGYTKGGLDASSQETVSGGIVAITDISPIEHNVAVKAESKNLLPYPYNRQTLTSGGITFTANNDSSVTAVGTITSTANFELTKELLLEGGKTYTFYSGSTNTTVLITYSVDGATKYVTTTKESASLAWKDNYKFISFGIRVALANGVTVNETVYPMVYEGTATTAWTPYVPDVSATTVKALGKNLLPYQDYQIGKSITLYGVTATVNEDGSILLNGTSTSANVVNFYLHWDKPLTLLAGSYIIGGSPSTECYISVYNPETQKYLNTNVNPTLQLDLTKTSSNIKILVQMKKQAILNNVLVKPFIVKKEAYDGIWEPYIKPASYPITADGTVEGVKSIYPNMTITTDTDGVIIEANYYQDGKKVKENLIDMILSLGGVINE